MNVVRSVIRRACLLTTCALAVGLAAAASAQTVLVDFGNNATQYRGIPVPNPDPKGHYWNSIQPGLLVTDMVDINNSPTTIDLGWDTPVGTDSYNGPAGPTDSLPLEGNLQYTDIDIDALGNLGVLEAAFDYATGPITPDPVIGNRTRFQLQGLDPAKTYSLTFYGSHIYSFDATTVYSIYTDDTYATLVDSTTLDHQDPLEFSAHNRDQVATIAGLAPQADNILYVEFVGLQTGELGYLNSMQIESSAAPLLVGDYNGNNVVDAADYTVWRNSLGTTNILPNDPIGGTIGPDQYNNWKSNFGMTRGGGSGIAVGSAVPEPGTTWFCLLASVGAACVRRRQ